MSIIPGRIIAAIEALTGRGEIAAQEIAQTADVGEKAIKDLAPKAEALMLDLSGLIAEARQTLEDFRARWCVEDVVVEARIVRPKP